MCEPHVAIEVETYRPFFIVGEVLAPFLARCSRRANTLMCRTFHRLATAHCTMRRRATASRRWNFSHHADLSAIAW